jgi:hypothetical protein
MQKTISIKSAIPFFMIIILSGLLCQMASSGICRDRAALV